MAGRSSTGSANKGMVSIGWWSCVDEIEWI